MEQIDLIPVESSQIAAIGHDADTNTLAVQFKAKGGPGSIYHYSGVDAKTFEDRYDFARIDREQEAA